ncbi:MAG: HAD family hydrolase, partial [Vicinamibacterales bacterium]|nr:HAD family hydrolase [Vicinamibacterales bacterium]
RDGTLIEDIGYLRFAREVAFYPWSVDAVRALNQAGLAVVVTTNQSGVARGILTEPMVEDVHRHISSLLDAARARIDAYYYCPHHPEAVVAAYRSRCDCRKPGCGMIERASADLDLDPARSFVVGDKWIDVSAARAAGARGILVRTGYGAAEETQPTPGLAADAVVDNLVEAVSWILRQC